MTTFLFYLLAWIGIVSVIVFGAALLWLMLQPIVESIREIYTEARNALRALHARQTAKPVQDYPRLMPWQRWQLDQAAGKHSDDN